MDMVLNSSGLPKTFTAMRMIAQTIITLTMYLLSIPYRILVYKDTVLYPGWGLVFVRETGIEEVKLTCSGPLLPRKVS